MDGRGARPQTSGKGAGPHTCGLGQSKAGWKQDERHLNGKAGCDPAPRHRNLIEEEPREGSIDFSSVKDRLIQKIQSYLTA